MLKAGGLRKLALITSIFVTFLLCFYPAIAQGQSPLWGSPESAAAPGSGAMLDDREAPRRPKRSCH